MTPATGTSVSFSTPVWLPYILFAALSLGLVSRALLIEGCLPFDANDDRNHTLVNYTAVQHSVAQNELPLYNYFNNFGTPLAGDGLTLPFAPHSLGYYLVRSDWFPYVLGFNRFCSFLATLVLLFQFFRTFAWTGGALAASLFATSTPGFVWHSAHHAYQFAIVGGAALLLLTVRHGQHRRLKGSRFVIASVPVWAAFALSTSPNLVAIGLVFVLYAALVLPGPAPVRRFLHTALAAALGTFLGLPELYPFVIAASEAVRTDVNYFASLPFAAGEYWPAALWGAPLQRHHTDLSVYVGLPLLLLGLSGAYLDFRRGVWRIPLLVVAAGLLPFIAVSALLLNPELLAPIPWLRAIDVTRVYWMSNIFLALGVARLSDQLHAFYALTPLAASAALLTWAGGALGSYAMVGSAVAPATLLPMLALGPTAALTMLPDGSARIPLARALICCIPLALLLGLIGRFNGWGTWEPCRVSHFYSTRADIFPPSFDLLAVIPPQVRLAAVAPSADGLDLIGVRWNVLGSGGRSIVASGALYRSLLDGDLVERDDPLVGYHFRMPRDGRDLEPYGITYLLSQSRPENEDGLSVVGKSADGWTLYENENSRSPFYLLGRHKVFLREYSIRGRSIEVDIGGIDAPAVLVATFTARRGIRASVDGSRRRIIVCPDELIRVPVWPGESTLRIVYWPYRSLAKLDDAIDRREARDKGCQQQ